MTITSNSTPTSRVGATGNAWLDALLDGVKWGGPAGTGTSVTFSFPQFSSGFRTNYGEGEPFDNFAPFTDPQASATRTILAEIAAAANISFREVPDGGNSAGELRFGRTGLIEPGFAGHAYFPGNSAEAGDIWLPSWRVDVPTRGSFTWMVLVHEIGHALGLKHPFSGAVTLPVHADTRLTTVMSYTNVPGQPWPTTMLPLDLLALQTLYGPNTATATGNDTYQPILWGDLRTIWDAGGTDLLSFAGSTRDEAFTLEAGTVQLSASASFAIAWNVVIENAAGGSGRDSLAGNAAANVLDGNAGDDSVSGLAGADLLRGGAGRDTLFGGLDADWLVGGADGDRLEGGAGFDIAEYGVGISGVVRQRDMGGNLLLTSGEGEDTLIGVERVVLADRTIALTAPQGRDLDGDLREDLLFLRPDGAGGMMLAASGAPAALGGPSGAALIGSADLFGDGAAELLWRGSGANLVTTWTDGVVAASNFYNPGGSWTLRAVEDFSGDGFADMFWQDAAGATWVWATRAGSFIGEGGVGSPGADWSFLGAGDLNGDGRADLLWRNSAGVVWSWRMDGTVRAGDAPVGVIGNGWMLRGVGDLDGDSRADLVWQHSSGQVWAWLVDGPGQLRNGPIGNAAPGWQVTAVADVNGDARADLVLRQDGTGILWQYEMFGTAILADRHAGNVPADWAVLG